MSDENASISCPNCGTEIDVNDILYHKVEEKLRAQYQEELKAGQDKLKDRERDLEKEKTELKKTKDEQDKLIEQQVTDALKSKKSELEKKIRKDAESEQKDAIDLLNKELLEKTNKVKELNKLTAENGKLRREKDELADTIRAEAEGRLNQQLADEREKIKGEEAKKTELKFKELEKQLEDQKKLTEEMKRKQEQGSMQLQGEVQELAIEEWIAAQFPLDTVQEIKKGERGADCLQTVHTRTHQNCGSIYYESKRTKAFSPAWIPKFKADIQDKNANIGVLVTEVMPTDMDRLGLKDGIWICSFDEFKGLSTVLRESLVQISAAIVTQENKGDKMGLLYDFLTSNEFQMQIEAIVEGFTQMKSDLDAEQRSMRTIWKKREKQIEKVISNTVGMYGSIKGIAGNAIQPIALLELPEEEDPNLIEDESPSV